MQAKNDYSKILLGHGIKFGKSLTDTKKQDIFLDDDARKGHFWCFGTTRVGKTRLIENMIEQDIKAGRSIIIIDPKNDNELFSKIMQVCMQAGRIKDLDLITPIFPQHSLNVNPLKHWYMQEEIVGNIMAGVEVGSEPFFYGVAYEASSTIVGAILLVEETTQKLADLTIKSKLVINYELIRSYVGHADLSNLYKDLSEKLEKLQLRLSVLSEHEKELFGYSELAQLEKDCVRVLDQLDKIIKSGADYYNKISSSLRVALVELCSGNIGRVLGDATENTIIDRLENNKPVVLVVQVASLLTQRSAFTTGKVIISMLGTLAGRRFAEGGVFNPTINLYIDEAQNVLYSNIDDLFAKAGGAGLRIHGFCQSVNQLYEKLGENKGNAILDNTNTKIFMKVPDVKSAEYASKMFGRIKEFAPVFSVGGGGASLRDNETDLTPYPMFNKIGVRDFYMSTYDGLYKGITSKTSPLEKLIKLPSTSV